MLIYQNRSFLIYFLLSVEKVLHIYNLAQLKTNYLEFFEFLNISSSHQKLKKPQHEDISNDEVKYRRT